MDNIILWIMAIAMVLGALDRMFGSRLWLGKQFEEGILAIGALSLSMLGILTLAPVLARLLRPVLVCARVNHQIIRKDASRGI